MAERKILAIRHQNHAFSRLKENKLMQYFGNKGVSLKKYELTNPTNSFFAYVKKENLVVETKNVVLNVKKSNSSYKKNMFSNGSTVRRVGPFSVYIEQYIATIKSYFDYFIEKKYKCRILSHSSIY